MSLRHFLTLSDLTKQELENLIKRASELRKMQHAARYISRLLVVRLA
ncbi:ornithine carbamoyltransferase [Psychrobacter sp. JCM 18902]|nr:ornithine carbamoyltransferase [Psychrobacter sp. JCM 18902]